MGPIPLGYLKEIKMMKRSWRVYSALIGCGLGLLAGCGDYSDSPSAVTVGQLSVQLTDAPFPFDLVARVDVFIVRVDAKQPDVADDDAANADDKTGWTTVATPNASINLLDLGGGKTTTLGAANIASGTYRDFRLVIDVDKSSVTLKDGTKPEVKWPSAGQSGLKINLDQPVVVTSTGTILIIDFDIGSSFVMRGNSIEKNGLLFKPVIHATVPDVTGSVSGSVRADNANGPGIAGASVEVLTAGTVLTDQSSANLLRTGSTDASGNFRIGFLTPGSYALRATPPAASGFKPALLAGGLTITSKTETSGQVIVVTK
jgi:hypothetical protein